MEKVKKSRRETRIENDLGFLKDAALNGDQQAIETIQTILDLDDEFEKLQAELADRQDTPRQSECDHAAWYQFMISGIRRLQEIPMEKERIIHETYGLNNKKIQILLESIKRRKIEDKKLYNP